MATSTRWNPYRYIYSLQDLAKKEERGDLAALRRSLGHPPGAFAEAGKVIDRHLPEDFNDRFPSDLWNERVYYLVGGLFALHDDSRDGGIPVRDDGEQPEGETQGGKRPNNLGFSMWRLGQKTESESIEARFVALLNADRDSLPDHLRYVVGLLNAHDISIDWLRLTRDLMAWEPDERRVQRRWARAYWRGAGDGESPEGTDSTTGSDAAATAAE